MLFEQCRRINELMKDFNEPWFIAGGWAIDLFIGKETREHQDIEISIFRKDQLYIKDYLKNWDFHKVINGEFELWNGDFLELPIHEIHAENTLNGDCLEVLLNETNENAWLFRREPTICFPADLVGGWSEEGIPYLRPEIVLLYKAKEPREKDHQDFFHAKKYLNLSQKKWLQKAIQVHIPGHPWLEEL